MPDSQPLFTVAGLGNSLLSDEGAGVQTIEALRADPPAETKLIDGGTLGLRLLPELEGAAGLVFVDAAAFDAAAGTLRVLEGAAMDDYLNTKMPSAHDVGLHDLVTALRFTDNLPDRRALIAIRPDSLEWGETLSPAVAAAIPGAVDAIRVILSRWRAEI